ncbi:NUDIX domain-containing protein [Nanoarchaeota archaeon]
MEAIPVLCAFIKKGNKILICKRGANETSFPGKWEMPGGKLEENETIEQGLKREIMEELSVECKAGKPLHCFLYNGRSENQYIEIVLETELINPEEIKLTVHDDMAWVTEEKLENYDISPHELQAIKAANSRFSKD